MYTRSAMSKIAEGNTEFVNILETRRMAILSEQHQPDLKSMENNCLLFASFIHFTIHLDKRDAQSYCLS